MSLDKMICMNEVELTQELVRINSENPPGNERAIAKYIKDFLDDLNTDCKKLSEKKNFILSWLIAKETGMEPLFLDKIFYVGGKYLKPQIKVLFKKYRNEYESILNKLILKIPDYY